MSKFILSIFLISIGSTQNDADSTIVAPSDSIAVINPKTKQPVPSIEMQETIDTTVQDTLVPLPDIRELGDKADKLPLGEPFFELKSSVDLLHQQMDSLKRVISVYEKGKGAMPTIDEELLNLIKVPELRHRIELQNGTIVNGEIIQEDDLGIIVQTSIGQLAIEMDRVVNITEDLPPNAKVEIMGEPYVNAFPDREEIAGTIKNKERNLRSFFKNFTEIIKQRAWKTPQSIKFTDTPCHNAEDKKTTKRALFIEYLFLTGR